MKKEKRKISKEPIEPVKRDRRMSLLLSEKEQRIIDRYVDKYKIANKSRWIRETVLASIYKKMDEDYPTLFDEHEMRR